MADSSVSAAIPTQLARVLQPKALSSLLRRVLVALGAGRNLAALGVGYVLLVRLLRYRRRAWHDSLARTSPGTSKPSGSKPSVSPSSIINTAPSLGGMSTSTAQSIFLSLAQAEFPFTVEKALQFALFRTYGIPSISGLLTQTSLLAAPSTAHKRYADTSALIVEFTARDFGSRESVEALARLNCIHGVYRRAGRISDDDMLYTLALFALEPGAWIARYEWRELTHVERCALGVFWKALGDAMDVPCTALDAVRGGSQQGPQQDSRPDSRPDSLPASRWRDGAHWLDDLAAWAAAYEASYMVPAESNARTAAQTTAILLWNVPRPFKQAGEQVVSALMDERLRSAMMYAHPSTAVRGLVFCALALRKYALRYLALPRPEAARVIGHEERDESGRVGVKYYQSLPYYVRPTLWNRWGAAAWLSWAMGLPVPGADEYGPSGFDPRTVGPAVNRIEQAGEEERVRERARMACPFPRGFEG